MPILGSIVQKGKFADCALAFDKQLNKVDLPTFGSPTIPHFKAIIMYLENWLQKYCFFYCIGGLLSLFFRNISFLLAQFYLFHQQ